MQQIGGPTYTGAFAITPSATTLVNCRAIYVGGAGNIDIKTSAGASTVTFTAPPVGSIIPLGLDQGLILATSTATLLVGLQ